MAKIVEEIVIIKISKLAKKDDAKLEAVFTADLAASIEEVIQEMVGEGPVVEVVIDQQK